ARLARPHVELLLRWFADRLRQRRPVHRHLRSRDGPSRRRRHSRSSNVYSVVASEAVPSRLRVRRQRYVRSESRLGLAQALRLSKRNERLKIPKMKSSKIH
ncbi:unnamed protein product, partial [Nesidiocoris tenuis]